MGPQKLVLSVKIENLKMLKLDTCFIVLKKSNRHFINWYLKDWTLQR